jgi:hypothetical protein
MDHQMLQQRFAVLTAAHLADACLRAPVPVRCASALLRAVVPGSRLAGRVCPARIAGSRQRKTGRQEKTALANLTVPEVRRLLEIALPLPAPSRCERFAWSLWRRTQCLEAQRSHYRHHFWPWYPGSNPFDTS